MATKKRATPRRAILPTATGKMKIPPPYMIRLCATPEQAEELRSAQMAVVEDVNTKRAVALVPRYQGETAVAVVERAEWIASAMNKAVTDV
jgi:hypothetical protein